MKPSQRHLSLLAATLAAGGRWEGRGAVREGLRLWEHAGAELAAQGARETRALAADAALDEYGAELPEGTGAVPLDAFLFAFRLSDGEHKEDRWRRWRDFTRHCIASQRGLAGAELDAAVAAALERERREGIPRSSAPSLARAFVAWRERETAATRKARATAGAAARHKPKKRKGGK